MVGTGWMVAALVALTVPASAQVTAVFANQIVVQTADEAMAQDALSYAARYGVSTDEAIARLEKFLDETTVTDQHTIRIVHGHGTGQLRRAIATFLKDHPLVASYKLAPQNEGGGGATIIQLKD